MFKKSSIPVLECNPDAKRLYDEILSNYNKGGEIKRQFFIFLAGGGGLHFSSLSPMQHKNMFNMAKVLVRGRET
jgi:hypothetical protein